MGADYVSIWGTLSSCSPGSRSGSHLLRIPVNVTATLQVLASLPWFVWWLQPRVLTAVCSVAF